MNKIGFSKSILPVLWKLNKISPAINVKINHENWEDFLVKRQTFWSIGGKVCVKSAHVKIANKTIHEKFLQKSVLNLKINVFLIKFKPKDRISEQRLQKKSAICLVKKKSQKSKK